ncbi:CapA family protein [Alloiococcus sp. CFN-8]|uniref:CapA family protein n=1 Tax=Alloiococcus sp. CFN-8 TaxID=3416081 RepID=UPI003CFBAA6A
MLEKFFKKNQLLLSILLIIVLAGCAYLDNNDENISIPPTKKEEETKEDDLIKEEEKTIVETEILLTFSGDSTLGTDKKFNQATSLPAMLKEQNNDYSYFYKNVKPIFEADDFTVTNLEGPLTTHNIENTNKQFNFKGDPELARALVEGSIEGVTLSNNHTYDYGEKGVEDTLAALTKYDINYFGAGYKYITELKGIKFGFLGYSIWGEGEEQKAAIKADIEELKAQGAIVIINAHWGIERDYRPSTIQINMAHYMIDNGADLIIGHHPHVVQSIEKYNDKFIFYSLGNFAFGGNSNPSDKDTMIVQVQYKFENDQKVAEGIKVIPTKISSVDYKNDYRPTPAEGAEKDRIFKKINDLNMNLDFIFGDEFHYNYQ